MRKITENDIEELAIDLLKEQGFQHFYGPDTIPNGHHSFLLRKNYEEVLLKQTLESSASRLNPYIPLPAIEDAFNQIKRIHSEQLISGNEDFHRKLTEGINVTIQKESERRGDYVRLIDFQNPEKNEYYAVNQFTVTENDHNHRPDIVLFIVWIVCRTLLSKQP